MDTFEKLGAFYLGKRYDADARQVTDELTLYDAKDLTTHAVCVGMTGSGKTGLCLSLLEEAAIDGIPAIAIDPKGDLGNLLLTFPELRPADFEPWIDPGEAARKGSSPARHAAAVADLWKKGLGQWGQDGSRIRKLRDAADFAIYTPGSGAGLQLSVLRSFDAPPAELLDDPDALRERVTSSVSGLLALLGIDPDPIRSREHILLSNLLQRAWQQGRGMTLSALIREIQAPPIGKVGVLDLDSFFPAGDRMTLAMSINNLLASPGFEGWMTGEPLQIPKLLWGSGGKPRLSILSIAHLGDAERMFFVTLLLNELVAWMRTQPGTTSLRALLYMDEVFGYFPPTANPPSKTPMLTLLKQARAYGVGVVLATQNPVDLDYKGLSNAGTWFLGRLQTERDKARVLEGLEGVSAAAGGGFDRRQADALLAGLQSRVFLMHNAHDDRPTLFHTRWAMSYLRGPLTRAQIKTLMDPRKPALPATAAPPLAAPGTADPPAAPVAPEATPPLVPPEIPQRFVASSTGGDGLVYRPGLLGVCQLHFARARENVDTWQEAAVVAPLEDSGNPWDRAEALDLQALDLEREGETGARFAELPARATRAKTYRTWERALKTYLYQNRALQLWKCGTLKQVSKAGESEDEFRARLNHLARERRDLQKAKLERKYGPKLRRIRERIRKAEQRIGREKEQYGQQKMQTAISLGATVLGALLGRKAASVGTVGRATTTLRGAGRAARERGDIERAKQDLVTQQERLTELERQFEDDLDAVRDACDPSAVELQPVKIPPRKSDINVDSLALVWTPWRQDRSGALVPAFDR